MSIGVKSERDSPKSLVLGPYAGLVAGLGRQPPLKTVF